MATNNLTAKQNFILRRNGDVSKPQRSSKEDPFADIRFQKVPKPGHPVKSTKGLQPHNLRPSATKQSRRSSAERKTFCDTDASGIDSTTVSGSVNQEHHRLIKQEPGVHSKHEQNYEVEDGTSGSDDSGSSSEGSEEEVENDDTDDPNNHGQQYAGQNVPRPPTSNSYPSTTSGPPSVVSAGRQAHPSFASQPFSQNGNPMRTQVGGSHAPNSGAPRHVQSMASSDATISSSNGFQKHSQLNLMEQVAQGSRSDQALAAYAQIKTPQSKGVTQQQTHTSVNVHNSSHLAQPPNGGIVPHSASNGGRHSTQAVHAPHGEQRKFEEQPINVQTINDHSSAHEEEDDEMEFDPLDHDPPELFQMELRELQEEKFDYDRKAEAFTLPAEQGADTLHGKLDAVFKLSSDEQSRFFASLDITEWEEAGDWFLGKFGDAIGKFKKARQEKRKAALAFEKEIQSRHEAVNKRRKLTDQAMHDMRTNGDQVLAGTPKSKKGKK